MAMTLRDATLLEIQKVANRHRRSLEGWEDGPDFTPIHRMNREQMLKLFVWIEASCEHARKS